jgi:UPF0755 protein
VGGLLLACGGGPPGLPVRVNIPPGASLGAAADSLARAGVLSSPRLFRLYAALRGHGGDIKPGTYALQRHMPWDEIVDDLVQGRGILHTITVPEGYALAQILPALARTLRVPPDSVAAAVRDTSLLHRLAVPTPTLEGYLFPDTYTFTDGTTARAAVAAMVRRFEQVWQPEWDDALRARGLTRHEGVTLASIVEKEAKVPEERPMIAGVYLNRLRARMLLQADPTVQYALGQHTSRVLYKDLRIDSPYNTYRYRGLPPGPIASPGEASLEATVHPAVVAYLYFVAHPDGHHEFHADFAGHTRAREAVRREAARGGRR